jgi:DnaJ-class molecular chaperone
MKVYNHSRQLVEKAKDEKCPRCKGFGATSHDQDGKNCYLCHGNGHLWVAESGWTRAKYAKMEDSQLF